MRNLQRNYRNNSLRETQTVVGEIGADAVVLAGEDISLLTIPKGVILKSITAISTHMDITNLTLSVPDSTGFPVPLLGMMQGTPTSHLISGFPVYKEAQPLTVSSDVDIRFGRLLVAIEYIDLDVVTGEQVREAEVAPTVSTMSTMSGGV